MGLRVGAVVGPVVGALLFVGALVVGVFVGCFVGAFVGTLVDSYILQRFACCMAFPGMGVSPSSWHWAQYPLHLLDGVTALQLEYALPSQPPQEHDLHSLGALVGALVVGALVVGALVVGALVGAQVCPLRVGALVGAAGGRSCGREVMRS